MNILLRKQMNNREYIIHSFMQDMIKISVYQYAKWNEDDSDEDKLIEEYYYDLSNIEHGKVYYSTEYLYEPKRDSEGALSIELLSHYTSDLEDDEILSSEWQSVEFEDFEISEDAEIIQLEELEIPEPEEDIIEKLEGDNRALTLRVEELKKQMEADKIANEEMTLEILDLMMGLL